MFIQGVTKLIVHVLEGDRTQPDEQKSTIAHGRNSSFKALEAAFQLIQKKAIHSSRILL